MKNLINFAFDKYKVTLTIFIGLFISGIMAYKVIPKESFPDVKIPMIIVTSNFNGAAAKDVDTQIIKDFETEFKDLNGVKEVTSTSSFGRSTTTIEFDSNIIIKDALDDVREKVDKVKPRLPSDVKDVTVKEVNINDQNPAITIVVSGDLPNLTLSTISDKLKDEIEKLKGVLKVDIYGYQEMTAEIIIDQNKIDAYGINILSVVNIFNNNNLIVSSGFIESETSKFNLKIDGLISSYKDLENLPVKMDGDIVITLGDVALIKPALEDPTSISKIDQEKAITLQVKKKGGANLLETVAGAKYIADRFRSELPNINISYLGDQSTDVADKLEELINSIILSIILVMIVLFFQLGWRQSILVSLSIPVSFLSGIFVLNLLGYTLNMVVLFALMMSIGMLVDGAIVVVEYAETLKNKGLAKIEVFKEASKKMFWPITASTLTTLAAFYPLVYWGGIMGEFMKFLPITLIIVLMLSLGVALILIPVTAFLLEGKSKSNQKISKLDIFLQAKYNIALDIVLNRPKTVILAAVMGSFIVFFLYGKFNGGVEFFPETEPNNLTVTVKMPGNYALKEKLKINDEIDKAIVNIEGVRYVSTTTLDDNDKIGDINVDLKDWDTRQKAEFIIEEIQEKTSHIAGIKVEARAVAGGPGATPSDIIVFIGSNNQDSLMADYTKIFTVLKNHPKLQNQKSDADFFGYDIEYTVDRVKAERLGLNVSTVGNYIKLATNGIKLGEYTPSNKSEKEDILLRYSKDKRDLSSVENMKIKVGENFIYINDVLKAHVKPKAIDIKRLDGIQVIKFNLDVNKDENINEVNKEIIKLIQENKSPSTEIIEKGNAEEQAETMSFLMSAFGASLLLMIFILLVQFHNFAQVFTIMSAVIFSTVGVFLFMLLTQQMFGIVMGGIGIISLAGIIINNNIVMIDTFNYNLKTMDADIKEIVKETAISRLRPIFLTTVTTISGLLPMFFQVNIDFLNLNYQIDSPSSQMWQQLSAVIVGGLFFATFITLILTPCFLYLQNKKRTNQV
jgi:multidrug efflux pump